MPNRSITVSVVIPCYNASRWIRATLESAVRQTYAPLEVILVDDGSTDDSAAIAESFGPPVRVIRQANQGESVARNVAIEAARGDYLQFLDADDLLAPEALQRQVESISQHTDSVALMGIAWFRESPQSPTRSYIPDDTGFFPKTISTNLAPVHCWLAPRKLVQEAGGFAGHLKYFEDWDLWNRVALLGPSLVATPFVGAYYRQHPQSQLATVKDADRARGHAAVMARLGEGLLKRPDLLEAHGEPLFWALWISVRRAREKGVAWSELSPVTGILAQVAARGPANVRSGRLAGVIRLLGPRWASRMHGLVNRQSTWGHQAAAI